MKLIHLYRKKPVVIEAIEFSDDPNTISNIAGFLGAETTVVSYENPDAPVVKIETLEGTMTASVGDFIIKGVKGEFYPCKPDIFAATYDRAHSHGFCPIRDTKQFRKDLDSVLSELKQASSPQYNANASGGLAYPPGYRNSRERSIAITKIQEAIMWLGMDLKAINEESPGASPSPYPESYNPDSPVIEPTADGLKL
jgi:hypothetical protein